MLAPLIWTFGRGAPMHHHDARLTAVLLVMMLACPLLGACKGSDGGGSPTGTGGTGSGGARSGTGGTGSGGASGTGGSVATGGSGGSATGGAGQAQGGSGQGGVTGSGGVSGSGGAATDAPATDAPATETAGEVPVGTGPLTLTSTAITAGTDIDKKYRCRSPENISPPLTWTPGPAGTLSYAVTMYHAKSVHWMLWDIPATTTSLPEAIMRLAQPPVPAGARQVKPAVDGSTWYGYSGPCPGSPNQTYQYYVYALKVAKLPTVTTESSPTAIDTALQANRLERALLTATASP